MRELKDLKINKLYLMLFAVVSVMVIIGLILVIKNHKNSSIPASITSKASFTIFYPAPKVKGLSPEQASINYSNANNGLSYVVYVDSKKVVISEEDTPGIFSQSGVYDYKLQQANEYSSFSSSAGEVDLTRPTGLNGQTVAWVNAKGTLTLARASQSLSQSQWQLLFNNMNVVN